MSTDAALPSSDILPDGYHCAVTWSVPFDFGGMTEALLHRSRAFVTGAGQSVDVLTFAYENDYDDIRCELAAEGKTVPGIRLRNLWEELAEMSDETMMKVVPADRLRGKFRPIDEHDEYDEDRFGGILRRRFRRNSATQAALQTDYFRPDGTIYASDRKDLDERGIEGGRIVSLCDSEGTPVMSWNQIWPLYLFWLDVVTGSRETYMIVDSKSSANFITRYRRPNVISMHLVHNSHLASGTKRPFGELSPSRKYVFERLDTFDAVVFLTKQQKEDVDALVGEQSNTCVIPNSRNIPPMSYAKHDRQRDSSVILASLTKRKRINHAIAAVSEAMQSTGLKVTLDIYGHGSEAGTLAALITESGLNDSIRLLGYSSAAKEKFKEASFTLLTSTLEGQGLVLVEAMSMGCIPISYDIPYGPADFITDGVNGFLVRPGDIKGLAERIVQIVGMNESELQDMRANARQTAEAFTDRASTERWGQEMRAAVDRKLAEATSR
ncbi:glycosyltransferase [Arthrobacter agilis]|nr:glycosyltransferase [Arthrobacter agilis]